jgi:hypothetical protein
LIPAGFAGAGIARGKGRSQVTGLFLCFSWSGDLGFPGRVISVERQRVALAQRLLLGRNSS